MVGALRLPTLRSGRRVDTVGALRLPTLHYSGRNTHRAGKQRAPAPQSAYPPYVLTGNMEHGGCASLTHPTLQRPEYS